MVRRGFLGVGLTELTPELRTHFGVPEESGVMVSKVEPGKPGGEGRHQGGGHHVADRRQAGPVELGR